MITNTPAQRAIVRRTKGDRRGPITRLMSPGDLGEVLKPFVFLDLFEVDTFSGRGFAPHPHSGIATLTTFLEGEMSYSDTTGKVGALHTGAVEFMQAGRGVWHAGDPAEGHAMRGYQLWLALPPELELADPRSLYLEASRIEGIGPARVLLGTYKGVSSPVGYPVPITYLHVRLKDQERWTFEPGAGQDVAWLAVNAGKLHTADTLLERELAVFALGTGPIELIAQGAVELVIGSAERHRHPLVTGYYSVHTSREALAEGERTIAELEKPPPSQRSALPDAFGFLREQIMPKKTVLVIGGGAAGHQIAYQLRDDADVTLVDPKTYWEVPMAVPRLLVEPDALAARMRYDSFLGSARHLQGKVTHLSDGLAEIRLNDDSQKMVSWDYAVIASGSAYMDPLIKAQAATEAERAAELSEMTGKLRRARAVVVAGGGPVGVETAAELRETFPGLAVTLVHGGARLLERAPSKFAGWGEKALRASNVSIVLNDMVTDPAPGAQPTDGKVRTKAGRLLDAEVVIWAGGVKPVTDYVALSWPAAVQGDGQLKVDGYLRLEGHPRVFVAGDVTNLPEGRLAIISGLHAKSVVANLRAILTADDPASAKLKPYKPAPPGKGMGKMMVVTLGRTDGLTSLPFGQFRAAFLARKIKSRDMLVGMSRKAVGQAR